MRKEVCADVLVRMGCRRRRCLVGNEHDFDRKSGRNKLVGFAHRCASGKLAWRLGVGRMAVDVGWLQRHCRGNRSGCAHLAVDTAQQTIQVATRVQLSLAQANSRQESPWWRFLFFVQKIGASGEQRKRARTRIKRRGAHKHQRRRKCRFRQCIHKSYLTSRDCW